MKRILISTDSYKGTLSSKEAGEIINSAFMREGFFDNLVLPLSDGGDGMTEAGRAAAGAEAAERRVEPRGRHIVLILPDADALGGNFDELGERVVKAARYRDGAAQ